MLGVLVHDTTQGDGLDQAVLVLAIDLTGVDGDNALAVAAEDQLGDGIVLGNATHGHVGQDVLAGLVRHGLVIGQDHVVEQGDGIGIVGDGDQAVGDQILVSGDVDGHVGGDLLGLGHGAGHGVQGTAGLGDGSAEVDGLDLGEHHSIGVHHGVAVVSGVDLTEVGVLAQLEQAAHRPHTVGKAAQVVDAAVAVQLVHHDDVDLVVSGVVAAPEQAGTVIVQGLEVRGINGVTQASEVAGTERIVLAAHG